MRSSCRESARAGESATSQPQSLRRGREAATQGARVVGAVADRGAIMKPIDHDAYETVTTLKQLDALDRAGARDRPRLRRYRNHIARCDAGAALRRVAGGAPGEACYIPVGHRKGDGLALRRRAAISCR